MDWAMIATNINTPLADTTIISTLAGASVTVAVLFFSLAIIPLQNLSQMVSNDVYQMVARNKRLVLSYTSVLLITGLQVALLVFFHQKNGDLYWSLFLTIALLVTVGLFFLSTRRLLNLVEFVLPEIERDFKVGVDRVVKYSRLEGKMLTKQKEVLEQKLLESFFGGPTGDDGIIVISQRLSPVLTYKMYTLIELARGIASRQQLTSFQKAWSVIVKCYEFYCRQTGADFKKTHDQFTYYFVEKAKLIFREIENLDEVYFQVFVGNIQLLIRDLKGDPRIGYISNSFLSIQVERIIRQLRKNKTLAFDSISELSQYVISCIQCRVEVDTNLLGPLLQENLGKLETITHSGINLLIHKVVYELLQNPKMIVSEDLDGVLGLLYKVQPSRGMTPAVFNDMSLYGGFNARGTGSMADLYISQILLYEKKEYFRDLVTILEAIVESMFVRVVVGGTHVGGLFDQFGQIVHFISALIDVSLFNSNEDFAYLVYDESEKRYFLGVILKILKVLIVQRKTIYRHNYFSKLNTLAVLFLRCCSVLGVDPYPQLRFYEFFRLLKKGSWGEGKNQLLETLIGSSSGKVKLVLERMKTTDGEWPFG